MAERVGIKLGTIIDNFHLNVLYGPEGYRERRITVEDVNRPGLQLTGFFDYFDKDRMQLLGLVEISYLEGIPAGKRAVVFDTLFSYHTPAVIFARGLKPYPECLEMAKKHQQVILGTQENTADIMSTLIAYLRAALSPTITRSGVLVEVYGEGVMLAGESGVGKSETAIELVKRGHRLIADDAVEIRLFGMSAVKFDSAIDMMIQLETWKDGKLYDRLGADERFVSLLDVRIPTLLIPVKPGRNLAVIIEVAAMNNRNKKMGYNAALEFSMQVDNHIDQKYLEMNPKQTS